MKHLHIPNRKPLWMLVSMGLLTGLLLTAFCWLAPDAARQLLASPVWPEVILISGGLLILTGARLIQKQGYLDIPKPVLFLAVAAGTALVYLFPELFAPGCNGIPKAFAACPASCQITTCSHWVAAGDTLPNGNICSPSNPWDLGCCISYVTTCDPDCGDGGSGGGNDSPPTITGSVACTLDGNGSWCRGGATLNLSASDPQGYATTISGDIDGTPFSCAGPNCTRTLPAGNGTLHFKATAATSGLSSATKSTTFAYDPTPPTANLALSGTLGAAGWYTSTAHASATGTDAVSGISTTQVSVDGGAWQASANLAEGTHTVSARAFDNAGNSTVTAAQTVKVDTTAPTVSASVTSGTQSGGWYVTAATITANASDATSGIAQVENRVDGGVWSAGSSATVSTDGVHTVDFRATDRAGLQSTTPTSVKIDKTAPSVTITPSGTAGSNGWYTSAASLAISALDPLSGVASIEYTLDSGNWTPAGSLTLNEGDHTVQARSTDKAGNVSPVTTRNIKVDTTPPSLASSISGTSGNGGWYVSDLTVTSNATDAISGIALVENRVDGGDWSVGSSATLSSDGLHSIDFRATDFAGLQSTTSASVKVDKAAPSIALTPSGTLGGSGWYTNFTSVAISALDPLSGVASIEYSLDGGNWVSGSSLALGDGIHTVQARAADKAGNLSPATTTNIKIDTTTPSLASVISGASGSNGWYVSDTTVTPSASDAASGIALVETRLDGGAWSPGGSVTLSVDGIHTIDFRATDRAGLVSTTSITVKVDKTNPSITFVPTGTSGRANWYTSDVSLAINTQDTLSGIASTQYRLDGGNWTTGSSLTLSDGEHTIEALSTDKAGNHTTSSMTIQVDTASPIAELSISATAGHMYWYVSEAVISADSSDATSGVALVEHRLDDGNWQTGDSTPVVDSDGAHTAEFRITDNAGNLTTATKYFWIDATPPASEFIEPLEGSTNTLYGEVNFSGFSSDATSGMSTVQISLDNGKSWQTLSLAGNRWHYAWDTRHMPDGTYPILARAGDVAGNIEHTARTTVVIANQLPKVKVQDWWWSWDAGQVKVNAALVPIQQTTITISCAPYHKDVVLHFKDGAAAPGELQWDRRCEEGAYAADAGDYPVTVQACDTFGRCTSAGGVIKVPFFAPPMPSWTPTAVPTATTTPEKTKQVQNPTPTRTALPPVAVPENILPAPALEPAPGWPWAALALVGFLMALASSSLADRRPPALKRLGQTLGRVLDGQK